MEAPGKREQILVAAEQLFAEHGYDGTSIRALAGKANVNVAMISYYFGSKEKLFEALVEYRAAFVYERLKSLSEETSDPMERMEKVIDFYVDKIFSHIRFHRILHRQLTLQQRSTLNEAIATILARNSEEVRKIIEDGISKKIFHQVDPGMLILSMTGTISQITNSSLLSCRILHLPEGHQHCQDPDFRSRVKSYLKDLVKHFLIRKT